MSCAKAYELDLAAFLLSPGDAAWDEFRAHYPGCPECAAEVAAWTSLEAMLRPEHPSPESLLLWTDDPRALPEEQRAAIESHLATCASCKDELRALDGFAASATPSADATANAAAPTSATTTRDAAPAARAGDASRRGSSVQRGGDSTRSTPLRRVTRVLWNPVVPYAAVLALLLFPTFRERLTEGIAPPRSNPDAPATAIREERDSGARGSPLRAAMPQPEQAPPADGRAARQSEMRPLAKARSDQLADAGGEATDARAAAKRDAADATGSAANEAASRDRAGAGVGSAAREQTGAAAVASAPARRAAPGAGAERPSADAAIAPPARDDPFAAPPVPEAPQRLVIPVPAAVRRLGEIELRVRARSEDRELRQKVHVSERADEISVELPADWLGVATWEVELRTKDGTVVARGVDGAP